MPEVLRPSLEGFGVELPVIGDLNKRVPKQMRIEIRQTRPRTGFAENIADRVGIRPGRTIQRHRTECEVVAEFDLGFREQRVVGSEALLLAKECDPVDNDLPDVVADRKEPSRESFLRAWCELRARLVRPFRVRRRYASAETR
jgi:hypothetical protein